MSVDGGLAALVILAWLAYLGSRLLARRFIPELVVFLAAGAILGPNALGVVSEETLMRADNATEVALAVLMFVIGERVSRRALREARWIVPAALIQYAVSGIAVFLVADWAGADRPVALLLGALAGAGAPMTVASVVSSRRASGSYPAGLIGTHALSDALATVTFAAVLPLAALLVGGSGGTDEAVVRFFRLGFGGVAVGAVFGWIVARYSRQIETSGELLLFVLVHLLVAWVLADAIEASLPLAALVMGAMASSLAPEQTGQRIFRAVRTIEQPLYLLFFALAGAAIHLDDLPSLGLVGVAYIGTRTVAKLAGGTVGGLVGGLPGRQAMRLGVDLLPQAGVAVALAVIASEQLPDTGGTAAAVVLGSVVLFELLGPVLVARGLDRAGASGAPRTTDRPGVELPEVVLVASPIPVEVPEWLVETTGRWGASLVVLAPPDQERDAELRERAAREVVDLRLDPLTAESLTGAVERAATESNAGLVVLFAPRAADDAAESRLVLLPQERIARRVQCPVLTIPVPLPADEEVGPARRFRFLGRFLAEG